MAFDIWEEVSISLVSYYCLAKVCCYGALLTHPQGREARGGPENKVMDKISFLSKSVQPAVTGSNSWFDCCIRKQSVRWVAWWGTRHLQLPDKQLLPLCFPMWSSGIEVGLMITHASSHTSCSYWVWQCPSSQCEVLAPRLAWYPLKDALWLLYKATVN